MKGIGKKATLSQKVHYTSITILPAEASEDNENGGGMTRKALEIQCIN